MKPITTWILIANGARARILEHKALGAGIKAIKGMEFFDEKLSTSDIMADKSGRAFASVGNSRSAIELKTDPVAKREAEFALILAQTLNKKYQSKAFNRLIIFAAPNALGDLRQSLNNDVSNNIIAEITKDLTKVPNDEIAKHLKDVMLI